MAKKSQARKMAGEDAKRIISASAFGNLMNQIGIAEASKIESAGRIGGLVSDAVAKHNVNKKALGWYRQARRLNGAKLRDLLEQFEHYCDIGGLNEQAHQQDEMFSAAERGTTEPSFAEKLSKARKGNGANGVPKRKPRRTSTPTADEVRAIANRAEQMADEDFDELH